jgi:hypothetical protein
MTIVLVALAQTSPAAAATVQLENAGAEPH